MIVCFLWNYLFVVTIGIGENFKAKAWERRICGKQSPLDKLSTGIHKLFVPTPQIASIGGTVIEV